jgi:acyl-CoA thioester hydrolase
MAGIVHFAEIFRYVEEAEHALWRERGLSIAGTDYGFPRVAASLDFQNPLRFEDEFDVAIRIAAVTRSTIRYECAISRGDTPIAAGSMTIVCTTKSSTEPRRSVEIPDTVLRQLGVTRAPDARPPRQ